MLSIPAAMMDAPELLAPAPSARPWVSRLLWLAAAAASWPVVALSFWLRPDARGFGTHQQLGLPPCNFQESTGVPCPGCGLTTSFANMAHGHVLDAFAAHLMGPLLFAITVAVAVAAPWAARRALPMDRVLQHPATAATLGVTLTAGLVTFGLRLVHMLHR
jgi:hypothetical protein